MEQQQSFELFIDGVPYFVKATPYYLNGETRYAVTYNGSPEMLFAWEPALGRLAALGDDTAILPDTLERAISQRLIKRA